MLLFKKMFLFTINDKDLVFFTTTLPQQHISYPSRIQFTLSYIGFYK